MQFKRSILMLAGLATAAFAQAQGSWPTKPITLVVPFAAGGPTDVVARTLGASAFQTFFRVTLKNIRWGLLYGIALTTARSIGEIGAVLIVSGQITGQTETATLYVLRAVDQFQDQQGYLVALTLALVTIVLLVLIEVFKRRQERTQRT